MPKTKTSKSGAASAKAKRKPQPLSPANTSPGIDIGISTGDRKKIAEGLSQFLADSYTLYLKTHNFHWNITGPMFNSLHVMFEGQYTEEWTALDEIAERIRALGFNAPGSYAEFVKLTSIKEETGLSGVPGWQDMVRQLVDGNEAVCRTARRVLRTADDGGDDPSVDLLTQRLQVHEKNAWMLRSLLE
ncbi:Dps family protein [Pseudoxanthomonas dokdonensis]|uniref:Ferritin n=1 Tax=Pseudoxanthomonas dokdonensis TaxID=344882 RepID=A0A0R0D1M8_9GAMM|nr:Dps family protein [Pseudoxanthomonas dokdonensis]KRG71475.1 ferritin [Pseudoxanthomonas dokdonensis]